MSFCKLILFGIRILEKVHFPSSIQVKVKDVVSGRKSVVLAPNLPHPN